MNIITGLPRSGSTLLCNILNQNPKIWAGSTSILPQLCSNLINTWSNAPEIKGDLDRAKEETENKLCRSLKAFCEAWHKREDGREVIFDKSRGWAHHILALLKIFPESKIIVTVRDLREVFASVEKQHRKNGTLDEANNPSAKTLYGRADNMFSKDGIIGGPIEGIEDIIRRKFKVYWVKYDFLVERPKSTMKEIYEFIEQDEFEHDFENVESTATDHDGLYLHKYPHKGEGKVEPGKLNDWKEYVPQDIADLTMDRFKFFNNFFGYR